MDVVNKYMNRNKKQNMYWESSDQFLRKRWMRGRVHLPSN